MSDDERAELAIVSLKTSDTHKFAIALSMALSPEKQGALERLMLRDWIRLIDVTPLAHVPGHLFRVFRVMPEAVAWYEFVEPVDPPIYSAQEKQT